jgi:DNA-binding MarR family transcriptional regulator
MSKSVLQMELGKKRPFDLLEQEVSLNLARTQDELFQEFTDLFESKGISGSQYNVLRILRGRAGAGTPCQEIAGQMINRMPDITRLVDRLEKAELVERLRTPADRRVVLIKITKKGLDLLQSLDQPVLDLHKTSLGHLSHAELVELNRLLVKARTKG